MGDVIRQMQRKENIGARDEENLELEEFVGALMAKKRRESQKVL